MSKESRLPILHIRLYKEARSAFKNNPELDVNEFIKKWKPMERNQELFNYLNETFDIVALESQLDEILNIVEKLNKKQI